MVTKGMCQRCRQCKQRCTPAERIWVEGGEQQPCDRCVQYGHECGPSIRLQPSRPRRRSRSSNQQALPPHTGSSQLRLIPRELDERLVVDLLGFVGDDVGVGDSKEELSRRLTNLDLLVETLNQINLAIEYLETNNRQGEIHFQEMYSLKNASTRQLSSKLGLAESLADRVYRTGDIKAAERAYTRILDIYRLMDIKAWHEIHSLLGKMATLFCSIGEPLRAEKLMWEYLELGDLPRHAQPSDCRVLVILANSLSRTSKDLSVVVQDLVIGTVHSKLAMSLPPLQRMLSSKYATDVLGNIFQTGPLTGLFAPIVGGFEAIQEIIQKLPQADLQATDLLGRTPLFMASDLQKEHFGLALMRHAASILTIPRRQFTNARDKSGQTTLGIATWRRCSVEYIDALIDHGAEVDPQSLMEFVMTPLQIASLFGFSEIVDLLLEHGAKPGRVWPGAKTATELAQEAGHNNIVEKLRSYSAG